MAANLPRLHEQIEKLTEAEVEILVETTDHLIQTRKKRTARVEECMRKIELTDDITRLVVGQYLRTYVEVDRQMVQSGQCGWTEELVGFSHRERVRTVAPGVYWAYGKRYMHEALAKTGEFKTYEDFNDAAEALQYTDRKVGEGQKVPRALDTVDHLVHWLAARYPESDAARAVSYYGTKAGRLMHGSTKGYNSWDLLFHESVLEDYVHRECNRINVENGPHRPIITLVSTGDWDKAVSLCSLQKQKKLLK